MNTHTHAYTRTHDCAHVHAYTRAYSRTHIHAFAREHTHAHTEAGTRGHAQRRRACEGRREILQTGSLNTPFTEHPHTEHTTRTNVHTRAGTQTRTRTHMQIHAHSRTPTRSTHSLSIRATNARCVWRVNLCMCDINNNTKQHMHDHTC